MAISFFFFFFFFFWWGSCGGGGGGGEGIGHLEVFWGILSTDFQNWLFVWVCRNSRYLFGYYKNRD